MTNTTPFTKQCPTCGKEQIYKDMFKLKYATAKSTQCRKCANNNNAGKHNRYKLGTIDVTPKYYVYLLIDPTTNEVFYVGKGQGRRMFEHVKEVRKGNIPNTNNNKLFRHIKQILDKGLVVQYEQPITDVNEITALAIEAAYIDYYGIGNLCNYQLCGAGNSNHLPHIKLQCSYAAYKQMTPNYNGTFEDYSKTHYVGMGKDLRLLDSVINSIRLRLINDMIGWLEPAIATLANHVKAQRRKERKSVKRLNVSNCSHCVNRL